MLDVLFWIALVVALISAVLGKTLLNLMAEYVKAQYPESFTGLAEKDRSLVKGFSKPETKVRRVLASRLLWGSLPPPLDSDEQIERMRGHWRILFLGTVVGCICVIAIIFARVPAAG